MLKPVLLLIVAASLHACVPYPIHKTLRPAAKATVLDSAGKPLSGAEVTLVSNSYPYGRERARVSKTTGTDGVARFSASREWRVEIVMIHGSESFFWDWCVRKQGYETFATSHHNADEFDTGLVVRLRRGVSQPCPKLRRDG